MEKEVMTIGRGPKADILVDCICASRKHCAIITTENGYWVQDLRSRGGTYLNRQRIVERTLLRELDRIFLPSHTFELHLDE